MTLPALFTDTAEAITARIVARCQQLDPTYVPVPGDDVHLMAEAHADELLRVGAKTNRTVRALFLLTAEAEDLDARAAEVGVTRLEGTQPTAPVTFTLTTVQAANVIVPAGTELTDGDGAVGRVTANITIPSGQTTGAGTLELDAYVVASDIKTEKIVSPLPFVATATQTGAFGGGAEVESDESLRTRAVDAWEKASTAGAVESYIYHARTADSRVTAVAVQSPNPCEIDVVYYSPDADAAMQSRIEAALNADTVRPLTDQVSVRQAVAIALPVTATLYIENLADSGTVVAAAGAALTNGMAAMSKLGRDVPLSKISSLLHVDGVVTVAITEPIGNTVAAWDEIAVLGAVNLTAQEYADA